jgi:hypothetical protein
VNGKQVFKSLKTESAEHAKTKLSAVLKEFAKMRRRKENVLTRELSRKRQHGHQMEIRRLLKIKSA